MSSTNKLLIVDGHNLLFQMFFGMPSRITGANGKPIQGVIGFVGALNRMVVMIAPTHLLVMFDGERNNPRKALLESYKANRIDYSAMADEENPFTQLAYIYHALDYMGICYKETTSCETDDVIASYAKKFGKIGEVYVSSFDSDYFQLIDENVKVLRYRGQSSVICDTDYIEKRYGIPPSLYLDFKCLVGDSADNIAGIRGIGPKTAAKIVSSYGKIDDVIASIDKIENEKIRRSILENTDTLLLNRKLIMLDGTADIPLPIDDIVFNGNMMSTMSVVHGIGL